MRRPGRIEVSDIYAVGAPGVSILSGSLCQVYNKNITTFREQGI